MTQLNLSVFVNSYTTFAPSNLALASINNLALFTTEQPSNEEEYGIYVDVNSVIQKYGTNSSTASLASAIFSQAPNIINGDGKLIIFPIATNETLKEAIIRIKNKNIVYFYGIITNKDLSLNSNAELLEVASYIQSLPKEQKAIFFHYSSNLNDNNTTNGVIKAITTAGNKRTKIVLHPDNQSIANNVSSAIISRLLVTKFGTPKSAVNLTGKQLSNISPNTILTNSDITNTQTTGAITYGNYESGANGRIKEYGVNEYSDNIYYQDMLEREIMIANANVLLTTNTRIEQTNSGMDVFRNATIDVMDKAKLTGLIAPGKWNSSYTFGDPVVFKRSIEQNGYYVYYTPVELQSQADREARKAPPILWACKFAGAVESIDLYGTIER